MAQPPTKNDAVSREVAQIYTLPSDLPVTLPEIVHLGRGLIFYGERYITCTDLYAHAVLDHMLDVRNSLLADPYAMGDEGWLTDLRDGMNEASRLASRPGLFQDNHQHDRFRFYYEQYFRNIESILAIWATFQEESRYLELGFLLRRMHHLRPQFSIGNLNRPWHEFLQHLCPGWINWNPRDRHFLCFQAFANGGSTIVYQWEKQTKGVYQWLDITRPGQYPYVPGTQPTLLDAHTLHNGLRRRVVARRIAHSPWPEFYPSGLGHGDVLNLSSINTDLGSIHGEVRSGLHTGVQLVYFLLKDEQVWDGTKIVEIPGSNNIDFHG